MKKLFLFLSIALSIGLFYFQSFKKAQIVSDQKDLVVGISPDYPPYAFIDLATGQIVGLEVDIINEIGRRIDKKIVIKTMPFNSLIIELIAGQIDIIAAGMSPSEERKNTVLFSYPYIDNDDNVVITKSLQNPIQSVRDLYGKQVAVNIGYTADSFLSKYPEINLVRLKSPADGFMALQSDSVFAFVIAQSIFNKFLGDKISHDGYQIFNLPASSDACALAFAKNNNKLQQIIDHVIHDMIADGTMQQIKSKWNFV
jgi:polar amino acid transport system substrate-binding protein